LVRKTNKLVRSAEARLYVIGTLQMRTLDKRKSWKR